MAYRINDRNIGTSKLDSSPKRVSEKLTVDEKETIRKVIEVVYEAMEKDEDMGVFIDGGRIVLSLTGEEMFDLFEAKRKLNG